MREGIGGYQYERGWEHLMGAVTEVAVAGDVFVLKGKVNIFAQNAFTH